MKRLRRLALALALVVVAAAGVTWSSAAFTTSHDEPDATLHAATVSLDAAHPAPELLQVSDMRPGQTRSGHFTLTNTGSVAATLRLRRDAFTGGTELASVLHLRLERCRTAACADADPAWSGTPADLDDVALGDLASGATATYRLTVDWPADEDDSSLQGAKLSMPLRWALVAGTGT